MAGTPPPPPPPSTASMAGAAPTRLKRPKRRVGIYTLAVQRGNAASVFVCLGPSQADVFEGQNGDNILIVFIHNIINQGGGGEIWGYA